MGKKSDETMDKAIVEVQRQPTADLMEEKKADVEDGLNNWEENCPKQGLDKGGWGVGFLEAEVDEPKHNWKPGGEQEEDTIPGHLL